MDFEKGKGEQHACDAHTVPSLDAEVGRGLWRMG